MSGFPSQDTGPGMAEMFHDLTVEQEEAKAAARLDTARRERVALLLDRNYPKVAACIRAGMRSSTWPEHLIDPGLLLDLLEAETERCAKIADAVASDAQEQIEQNDEYKRTTGSRDEEPNNLCRHRKHSAERIAADIRRY
jgi:hypothetical protein